MSDTCICEANSGLHHRKKVKFIRIDGSTPPETRGGLVDKFQHNADVRLAILSINAAGTGLTLTVDCLQPHKEFFMYMHCKLDLFQQRSMTLQLCDTSTGNMLHQRYQSCTRCADISKGLCHAWSLQSRSINALQDR